jgi:hypothetical protein
MKAFFNFFLLLFLLLIAVPAEAKRPPKWKKNGFINTSSGIRANIRKAGKSKKPRIGDNVRIYYARYSYKTKEYIPPKLNIRSPRAVIVAVDSETNGFLQAVRLLGKGGKGFFIVPPADAVPDSSCYYIELLEIIPAMSAQAINGDTLKKDSINFSVNDPAKLTYGDTLFSTVKLLEAPKIISCGIKRVLVACRFRLTWFDNGVKRKDILVYIECPESFGAGFFVAGQDYIVTAIPLLENHKEGMSVYNPYSNEKIESYLGLRLTKGR